MTRTLAQSRPLRVQTLRGDLAAGFAAVVHGAGGVSFIAVASALPELWQSLGGYVGTWAPYQLDAAMAARVREALARDPEGAVRLYFRHAGRWEPEVLVIRELTDDGTALCGVADRSLPPDSDPA